MIETSYETEGDSTVPTGSNGQITEKDPGTEFECRVGCDLDPHCWGFAFTPSIPKCVMYDQIDDPFYLENNKVYSSGKTLFMKRCKFESKIFNSIIFLFLFSLNKWILLKPNEFRKTF